MNINISGIGSETSTDIMNFLKEKKVEFNLVVTKPKWEDFGKIFGFYIESDCNILETQPGHNTSIEDRNLYPTYQLAEAGLALIQLLQWRDRYNEGWYPDYTDSEFKYHITFQKGEVVPMSSVGVSHVLTFKTSRIRDLFLSDFEELIIQAKLLL